MVAGRGDAGPRVAGQGADEGTGVAGNVPALPGVGGRIAVRGTGGAGPDGADRGGGVLGAGEGG